MKISIVTPSYQQGRFLEASIRSVLDQNYPDLEYFVIDGGSTDESVEIIKRYESRLSGWVSERDGGHFFALNKGFAMTTGEVMGFINSDDMLMPWSLSIVGEIFAAFPEVEWLTSLVPLRLDVQGRPVRCLPQRGFSREGFMAGENLPRPECFSTGWIQQESTFWRRSLWEKAGSHFVTDRPLAADWELWYRFFQHAELYGVEAPLGAFRFHGAQKTGDGHERYVTEGDRIFARDGRSRPGPVLQFLRQAAYESCPKRWEFLAGRLGLLHAAKVVRHNRHTSNWRIVNVWS